MFQTAVAYEGGRHGHGVQHPLDGGGDLDVLAALPAAGGASRSGQFEQVGALVLIEEQGLRHRFQHVLGDTGDVALLQPCVPPGAHAGEGRDLLAA